MKGATQLSSLPTGHSLRQWWGPEPLISNIQARQGRRTLPHRQALAMQSVSRFLGVVHYSGQWEPLPCGLSLPPGAPPTPNTHTKKTQFLSAPTFNHFSNPTPLQSLWKEGQDTGDMETPRSGQGVDQQGPRSASCVSQTAV